MFLIYREENEKSNDKSKKNSEESDNSRSDKSKRRYQDSIINLGTRRKSPIPTF